MQGLAGALEFSGLVFGANWVASGGSAVGYTWFLRGCRKGFPVTHKGHRKGMSGSVAGTEHVDVSVLAVESWVNTK